jgi:Protein of unknown function (DUF1264)
MNRRQLLTALGASTAGLVACGVPASADHGKAKAPGGAGPMENFHAYLCAFHTAKKDSKLVFEAHHYCMQVSDGVHQCVIFDCNGRDGKKTPKILGVEYIITDQIYRTLPVEEQKYYHPHAYEITSGLLIAPDMEVEAETKLMEGLVNTWGKTWHTWPDPTKALPMGEPLLMWAATKDGLVDEATLAQRDKQFKCSTKDIRKRRAHIGPVPQVDPPKSLDELGRQWTSSGRDEPQRR